MPHIHTGHGEHDHTASAFIVRLDQSEPKILLHKHKKTGLYQQFGGHIELSENPWQAVTHELLEESGYGMEQLQLLQPHERIKPGQKSYIQHPVAVSHNTHKFDDGHKHIDVAYAFVTEQEPAYQLAAGESAEFILVTYQELKQMPEDQVPEGIKDIGLFIFETCLAKWERVKPDSYLRSS
jgi:8-oxo-dGTP pyrophosphatase MutT (NUDIX family)